jgi:L-fuculose-phosphate aldolase
VYIGGDVPVAEYATTGSAELGEAAASRLGDRAAVLLANHGMVTVGPTIEKALHAALLVERTAQVLFGARLIGKVHDLPAEVNKSFADVYKLMRHM